MAKIEESVIKTSENSSHIWCAPRDVFQEGDQPSMRNSKSQIFPVLFAQVTSRQLCYPATAGWIKYRMYVWLSIY